MPSQAVASQAVTLTAEVGQYQGYNGPFITGDAAQQPVTVVLPNCS